MTLQPELPLSTGSPVDGLHVFLVFTAKWYLPRRERAAVGDARMICVRVLPFCYGGSIAAARSR
jgi:hypothetical protein